jgi:nucleoside-diphosphate-sugar epimerase
MITWITNHLGTASFYDPEVSNLAADISLVDIRELTDKEGNSNDSLNRFIATGVDHLNQNKRVVVCCDKGISRSNSVAFGILLAGGKSVDDTLELMKSHGLSDMNISLIHQISSLYSLPEETKVENSIMVTGGSGFIGRALKDRLTKSEFPVFFPTHDDFDIAHNPLNANRFVEHNQVKTIVHLAHPHKRSNISSMGESVQMMHNLLDISRINNCRLIYLSSLTVFSGCFTLEPVSSTSITRCAKGIYGESKLLCEDLVQNFKSLYNLSTVILRPAGVYGFGQDPSTFIEKFIVDARSNRKIIVHEYLNGRPIFDFLYIDDLVDAIYKILVSNFSGILDIGTGIGYSTKDVAETICDITKSSSLVATLKIEDQVSKIIVDPSLADKTIGWKPQMELKKGLESIINSGMQR